jgi:xylulokinase
MEWRGEILMTQTNYFVGVDIGTQGTKVCLVSDLGEIVASSFRSSNLIIPSKGVVEQLPEEIFSSVVSGIKEVMERSGINKSDVVALGLDGQMAGIIGIDSNWKAVTPYDSWLDTRCESYMPMIKQWGEEHVIQITGSPVSYAHGPKVLWWKHERPEIYSNIDKFIVPTAYVAGRLAGLQSKDAYIDFTHLHFSGFADTANNRWSPLLLDTFKVTEDKMPRIINPWDIIGSLTGLYADACGLLAGTPITAGCGDTAATTLGAGITAKGMIFDVAGTASVLSCSVDRYKPDIETKTLIYAKSVLPDLWTPLAYINGGGQCLSWYRQQLCMGEHHISYDELNAMAAKEKAGVDGLYFIPHFGGSVCPNNPLLRGAWIGINWTHNKASMYRAIMESIAYEYNSYYEIIKSANAGLEFTHANVVGGGAKSELFNSIKADVLNVPYSTLNNSDTATIANAVIAGYGIGLYKDIPSTIERFVNEEQRIEPNMERHQEYQKFSKSYPALLEKMTSVYDEISYE